MDQLSHPESIVWGFVVPNEETYNTKREPKTAPMIMQLIKNRPGN